MSKKPRLTREQEHRRTQGLRLLARIIARHHLAHPELYPAPGGDNGGGTGAVGQEDAAVNTAARASGDAARKEANQ